MVQFESLFFHGVIPSAACVATGSLGPLVNARAFGMTQRKIGI